MRLARIHADSMIELGDVVAATDSSERGAKAVVTGAACARRADAELAILSVVEALLPPLRPETAQWLDEHTEETRREVEEQARQARAEHAPVHIAQGLAAPVIAEKVQELGADLLVVGAHPQPAVSRFLLGSTTERLVRLVSCPLLVTTEERTDPFERVLVAVDLSPQSRDVLEQALAIARTDGAEVRAVHVVDPLTPILMQVMLAEEEESEGSARRQFERLIGEATSASDVSVEAKVLRGRPVDQILQAADDWDADLVVMGTHGFGFFHRLLIGSTGLRLLREGQRSTLVVPRREGD